MDDLNNVDRTVKRIDGQLYETFVIKSEAGDELQRLNIPLKVEFRIHDVLEILVGASILAVPVAFTEEVWDMGDQLPWLNVVVLSVVSLIFIGSFVYYTSYRRHLGMFRGEYLKRVLSIFFITLLVVGFLLTIVNKCPWSTDFAVALKRVMIGAFPASLSATVTDNLSS